MTFGFCWKCHQKSDSPINFKSLCQACGSYLHTCVGCQFYQIGKPNDCQIPNTEPIRDREHFNYCEDFKSVSEVSKKDKPSVEDIAKRLFKD